MSADAPDPLVKSREPGHPADAPGGAREVDLLLPLAAAICVALGWYVVLDYERAVVQCLAVAPDLTARVRDMRLMMALLSVGGLGLAFLAVRDARRRRRAEDGLRLANEELARLVDRRTSVLIDRTRALRESRLREKLAEREAESAFAAGQDEAAGTYLHGVGNALSALELELLRLTRALDGAERLGGAFAELAGRLEAGETAEAARLAAALREAVVARAMPRLAERAGALGEIKARMLDDLERYREAFERRGRPRHYLAAVRLDEELGAILDRMPRSAGHDPVARDIAAGVVVTVRRQPFLTGLAALLRQVLDAATGAVTVRLGRAPEGAVILVLEGAPEVATGAPAVAVFINFLNENGGALRYEPSGSGRPSRLVLTLAADGPLPGETAGLS
ncbi:MAG: hypothetical protein AAGU21_14345 [Solidesulfovibrio sp.]|uniref:hypothetical protein n=1 Tax=Solidesulfovibrio sp. TaxID=2910990 RepID=UPI002B21E7BF|nr:hypothetical protein [Solidesulfovibrio sp.]MEA4857934.1 hypothetical protein [Solidesulfovibrio sp.]